MDFRLTAPQAIVLKLLAKGWLIDSYNRIGNYESAYTALNEWRRIHSGTKKWLLQKAFIEQKSALDFFGGNLWGLSQRGREFWDKQYHLNDL